MEIGACQVHTELHYSHDWLTKYVINLKLLLQEALVIYYDLLSYKNIVFWL